MPRIVFMGTPEFSVPILTMLIEEGYSVVGVVTQPDRPKGRKRVIEPTPVKVVAQKYGVPVFQPEKLRNPEEVEKIVALQPDLIVTAAYGQILPQAVLDVPRHGCINVHASLLPKYRGGAPIHKAIVDGERETGITIMYMVKALDAGDVISQRTTPITKEDTAGTMYEKLSCLGSELLKETLPLLIQGELKAIPQDERLVTYAYNITREDERLDWTRSSTEIYDHVRGLHPWPVAYAMWKEEPFKVWRAEDFGEPTEYPPGTVIRVDSEGIFVATGSGQIILKEIQLSGKKRMDMDEFIRGGQMNVGEKLE